MGRAAALNDGKDGENVWGMMGGERTCNIERGVKGEGQKGSCIKGRERWGEYMRKNGWGG